MYEIPDHPDMPDEATAIDACVWGAFFRDHPPACFVSDPALRGRLPALLARQGWEIRVFIRPRYEMMPESFHCELWMQATGERFGAYVTCKPGELESGEAAATALAQAALAMLRETGGLQRVDLAEETKP